MRGVIERIPKRGRPVAAGLIVLSIAAVAVAGRGGRAVGEAPAIEAAAPNPPTPLPRGEGGPGGLGAAATPAARPVALGEVVEERVSLPTEATGTVQAAMKADISPKIMGKVAHVAVREGDRVRAGQMLVRLESADLAAQVAQAKAAVESARAAVKQARTGAQIQTTQSSTRVELAKAGLDAAREQLSLVTEGPRRQQKEQSDIAVREAEAAVAQAKASLSLVREGTRRQQKLQAQQTVIQAEAQYRTAKATHDRFKTLVDQEVIPRQRYDEVKLQLEAAAAQLEIAKQQASLANEGARPQEVLASEEALRQAEARLAMAKQQRDLSHAGGREQEIAAARAQVRQAEENLRMAQAATAENSIKRDNISLLIAQQQQAEAALRATQVQAGYATLTAPFSGVVSARLVDPGDMAAPGMPVLRIEDAGAHRLECSVPESRVPLISRGQSVAVALESLGWKGTGKVVEIVPGADPSSRSFLVKVGLGGVPRLASGISGKAYFAGDTQTRLVAPASAVTRRGQLESVMVVDEHGVAHLRLVRVGKVADGKAELLSGVQAGDRVIVEGAESILDGAKVR